jgi:putative membrane protein
MMSWGLDGWVWLIVWIAALLAMVWLIFRDQGRPAETDAMEILRGRFARGEITEEDFEHARAVLLDGDRRPSNAPKNQRF